MTHDGNLPAEGELIDGRVTQLLRVGDKVRRPATGSTESMRQLLAHLERSGFTGAPRMVASEPDGSVWLTWIDGWVPTDNERWKLDEGALASVGALLRSYHDCVQGFASQAGFEEGPQAVAEGGIVCHGDIAARMVVEVVAGCRRSVARKAAAGIPAFVQMRSEGLLKDLDSRHLTAEQSRSLIEEAALSGIT